MATLKAGQTVKVVADIAPKCGTTLAGCTGTVLDPAVDPMGWSPGGEPLVNVRIERGNATFWPAPGGSPVVFIATELEAV